MVITEDDREERCFLLRDYFYGGKYEVHTDNNHLTYVLTSAKLDSTGHHWLANLLTFDFSRKYWPGKQNIDAGKLSRQPQVKWRQKCQGPASNVTCQFKTFFSSQSH